MGLDMPASVPFFFVCCSSSCQVPALTSFIELMSRAVVYCSSIPTVCTATEAKTVTKHLGQT